MTPDGISTEDWDRVHELAVESANASGVEDWPRMRVAHRQMVDLLDELQEKYGALPSLLATRADYVDEPEGREYWLLAAYDLATQRADPKNRVWIASSLAGLYLEDVRERAKGQEWLTRLTEHLKVSEPPPVWWTP